MTAKGCAVSRVVFDRASTEIAETIASTIATAGRGEASAIIYAVPIDLADDDDWPTAAATIDEVTRIVEYGQILSRLYELGRPAPAVWITTRHGRSTGPADPLDRSGLLQSALLGAARTLAIESADVPIHLVDLDRTTLSQPEALVDVMSASGAEGEMLVRRGKVFLPRLGRKRVEDIALRSRPADRLPARRDFALRKDGSHGIDALYWEECAQRPPAAGEARVRVTAGGLNFRDVMAATGLLPKGAEPSDAGAALGLEFAGEVESVGVGVETVAPGDYVLGMTRGSLRRTVTLNAERLHRVPADFSDAEAASIPSVYLTAHYALSVLGRVREGETILVHTGTGGVGLAAIAVAKRLGAEIFATAGSPEKRAYLKALGVREAMDFAHAYLCQRGSQGNRKPWRRSRPEHAPRPLH